MSEFELEGGFYGGLTVPTLEEVNDFEMYASENHARFSVLGAEQFDKGQVVDYDDAEFQEFLDKRIAFAKKRELIISPPSSCGLNQSSLGSCSGASATGAQMSAVYNSTVFGVPATVPRLNCMIMYVTARGSSGEALLRKLSNFWQNRTL